MDFDAAITIGGRSLLDGLMRLLQPALKILDGPLPIDVAGLTGSAARFRQLRPSLVRDGLRLRMVADLVGQVPIVTDVVSGGLTLPVELPLGLKEVVPPRVNVNIPKMTGSLTDPPG